LAVTFPSVTVHLLRLAPGGPKGIDDLRAALGERFPTWLEDALAKTLLLEPEQSFLFPALIGLETIAELIPKLPAMERERTIQRLVQMTAFARAAKDQPRLAVERFCEIAQKVSRLTKAAFEKSVEDELLRICAQFQSSTGPEAEQNTPPGFDETVEPWLEPVDGEELLNALVKLFRRFSVLEKHDYYLLALWTMETYLTDCFKTLGILRVRSPEKRCGKSSLLDVLELVVLKPLLCVTVTPASLYRLIEAYHPTILIDEADSFGSQNDDLRAIVNAGYERGRRAPRTNPETGQVDLFDTFGCKLLASIGLLHETIEDRSLTIFMNRKLRNHEVEMVCDVEREVFRELKRKIQRWANDHRTEIKDCRHTRPKALFDRNWKIWRPLISIASAAGEGWVVQTISTALKKTREEESEASIRIEILWRLRELFRERKADFLSTVEILRYLNADQEAEWSDWVTGIKKGLTSHRLGRELAYFKVRSDKPRLSGGRQAGYWLKDLQPHFDAYLSSIPEPPDGGSKTTPSETFSGSDPQNKADQADHFSQVVDIENVNPVRFDQTKADQEGVAEPKADQVKPLWQHELPTAVRFEPQKRREAEKEGPKEAKRTIWIPPSIPPVPFCTATHPDRLLFLDIETFYPWPSAGDYPQPKLSSPGLLTRKERRREAHPYAKDPRRCALRFLNVQCGDDLPITHDMMDEPVSDLLRDLIASSTVVGHNLDFDISVLRRYGDLGLFFHYRHDDCRPSPWFRKGEGPDEWFR